MTGALFGAEALSIISFGWGGWMTPATGEKLAAIDESPSYNPGQGVMDAGWAPMPGAKAPDKGIAAAWPSGLETRP